MKRFTIWTLVLVISLSVAALGCGSASKTTKTTGADLSRNERGEGSEFSVKAVPSDTPSAEPYLLANIHFDFDRYDLRSGDREALARNAKWLSENPGVRVLIEGHCDERGTVEYNQALGERRARTARDFLVDYGIAPSRIEIISYGKEKPLDSGRGEIAWAKNRRDAFVKR